MPTITHTPLGKVSAIWGSALIRDANGKMRVLKVDDEVKNGDVILTTQGGFVRISEIEPAVAAVTPKPAPGTDVDRVIAGLNDGDLDIAPGAGLRGGDGGEFLPGLRVDRISESVTPGLRIGSEQERARPGEEVHATQLTITPLNSTPPVPSNVAPVADTGDVTGDEDATLPVPLRGSDSDGSVVSVTVTSIPPGGTLLLADGSTQVLPGQTLTPQQAEGLLFKPAADFNGKTGITFFVTDNEGLASEPATVTINVTPVNDPPTAVDDTNYTAHNTPVTTNVLVNDTDPDGGTLSVTSAVVTDPAQGSVVVNPDGSLTFTPADGFSGTASITYSISDGRGGTDSATLVVSVAAAPPVEPPPPPPPPVEPPPPPPVEPPPPPPVEPPPPPPVEPPPPPPVEPPPPPPVEPPPPPPVEPPPPPPVEPPPPPLPPPRPPQSPPTTPGRSIKSTTSFKKVPTTTLRPGSSGATSSPSLPSAGVMRCPV